jgi:hypothetical protein
MTAMDWAKAAIEKDLAKARAHDRKTKMKEVVTNETEIKLDGLIDTGRPVKSLEEDEAFDLAVLSAPRPVVQLAMDAFQSPRKATRSRGRSPRRSGAVAEGEAVAEAKPVAEAKRNASASHYQLFTKLERAGYFPDRPNLQRIRCLLRLEAEARGIIASEMEGTQGDPKDGGASPTETQASRRNYDRPWRAPRKPKALFD